MARTPQPTVVLAAQSMAASFTLPAGNGVRVAGLSKFSLALRWTGAPTGNFQFQVSHDGVNWNDRGSVMVAGGAGGDGIFEEADASFNWARIDYVRTSGTGVVDATLNGVEL